MVECQQDRYQKRGQVIAGTKKREWLALKNHLNLIDVGNTREFSWQNYGEGPSLRKARLDRCYISQEIEEHFIHTECKVSYSTSLSAHYPIITKIDNEEKRIKNKWFHTNPSLFKLPMVQEEITRIWKDFFSIGYSPAKAWSLAVKSTQSFLICVSIGRKKLREHKKKKAQRAIEKLEKEVNEGQQEAMVELREQKKTLSKIEDKEVEEAAVFFREWWVGQADRPSKQMFQMLKVKQSSEFIPLLKYQQGNMVHSEEENKEWIRSYYQQLFQEPEEDREEQEENIGRIKQAHKQVLLETQRKMLENVLTKEEIGEAIDKLRNKKSLGKDGLPAEFYKTFKEILIQPLLEVWIEATHFQALPTFLNEGIIKLIHKQEEKENIKNSRPITMLNCAYKIFSKAIALRLCNHMKEWINKDQKGFIKGRYILNAIIAIWEGMDFAEETKQDYIFFKIDFEKA